MQKAKHEGIVQSNRVEIRMCPIPPALLSLHIRIAITPTLAKRLSLRQNHWTGVHPTLKTQRSTHTNRLTFTKDTHSRPNEQFFPKQVAIYLS